MTLTSNFFCIVSKGNSGNLMKITSKRRRSRAQIEEEKKQEKRQRTEADEKVRRFDEMAT